MEKYYFSEVTTCMVYKKMWCTFQCKYCSGFLFKHPRDAFYRS